MPSTPFLILGALPENLLEAEGNVRELEHEMERVITLSVVKQLITPELLSELGPERQERAGLSPALTSPVPQHW